MKILGKTTKHVLLPKIGETVIIKIGRLKHVCCVCVCANLMCDRCALKKKRRNSGCDFLCHTEYKYYVDSTNEPDGWKSKTAAAAFRILEEDIE